MRTTTKLITGGLTVLTMSTLLVGHAATVTSNDAPMYHEAKTQQDVVKPTKLSLKNTAKINREAPATYEADVKESENTADNETPNTDAVKATSAESAPVAEATDTAESRTIDQTVADGEVPLPEQPATTSGEAETEPESTQTVTGPIELGNAIFADRIRPVRYANEGGLYTIVVAKDEDTIQIEVRQDNPDGTISNIRGMFYYHPSTDQIEEMHILDGTIHPFE